MEQTAAFLGPKIWEILPDSFSKIDDIDTFKKAIKTRKPSNTYCRLCRVYVQKLCFSLISLEL